MIENQFLKSMKAMVKAYDKNRTQYFGHLDELEAKAGEGKQVRDKIIVKKVGNIKHLDRDFDDVFDNFSKSGRITVKSSQNKVDSEKTTPRGTTTRAKPND